MARTAQNLQKSAPKPQKLNFQRYVVLIVNAGGLPDFRDRLPKLPKLAGSSKTCVNF